MSIGNVVQVLMEERDLNQVRLAKELNIPKATLGNYIRDERQPDYDMLIKIADYFNVSTDHLLSHNTTSITDDELKWLRMYRNLSPEQKSSFLLQIEAVVKSNLGKKEKTSSMLISQENKIV